MLTIVQALKREGGRYTVGGRWLSWDDSMRVWTIYEDGDAKPLAMTKDQKTAVDFLLGKR